MKDVTILDLFQNAAVVKVVASGWIDYLQVAKFNGDWKIVKVLWEMKPKDPAPPKSSRIRQWPVDPGRPGSTRPCEEISC